MSLHIIMLTSVIHIYLVKPIVWSKFLDPWERENSREQIVLINRTMIAIKLVQNTLELYVYIYIHINVCIRKGGKRGC